MARFADLPTAETSVIADAPVERIWELVTDINFPSLFSKEFRGAEWLDDSISLGARFVGRNSHPGTGEWETTCTVEVFEPLRSFGYLVNDPDLPAARWRYDLEPQPEGGVRIRMWAQMGPGRSGVTYFIHKYPEREEEIVAARLQEWRTNMDAVLAGMKQRAEGGSHSA